MNDKEVMAEEIEIPIVDIGAYVRGEVDKESCQAVARGLSECGCLIVKDPRVDTEANETFLDMMERFFEQSDGKTDARPELHYQVGVTPARVEQARNHCEFAKSLQEKDRPYTLCPPDPDEKWRYFWRVGPRPESTDFENLNAEQVIPKGFEHEWSMTMDTWGEKLLATAKSIATMFAIAQDLPADTIANYLEMGPHLLAPTGSDLNGLVPGRDGPFKTGAILAAFHYDLNFLTVHGKSRFPGLTLWRRDGKAVKGPKIPKGHLLVQAGKQFEWLTGGKVLAGFHEVIANDAAAKAAEQAALIDGASLWRVSSTCFTHVASDKILKPLIMPTTASSEEELNAIHTKFPPIKAGDQVMAELQAIKLGHAAA